MGKGPARALSMKTACSNPVGKRVRPATSRLDPPELLAGQRLGPERAFSMMEVSFAMALLGIVLIGMLGGLNWVVSSVQSAREEARATQLMEEKLDTLRLYSWDQLNTPGFIQTNFTATCSSLSNIAKGRCG
jgi:type II secretory pathway pseudopilin PulG